MNVHFVTNSYMFLCMASTIFSDVNKSGSPVNSAYPNDTENEHRMLRINISDARGKRHNLPLVEVDNADLHRIATCTKAPGRLICKSGRYNYVINNGNFEFPAETLEKFVSALYQKAKDQKESDFAVAFVAPEKEAITPSTANLQLATLKSETTESVDQLQPVTIECELTDAKTLKETNPDYQPKPNERVFKCITKRIGFKKKKRQHTLMIGSGYYGNLKDSQTKNIISHDRTWKLFHPPWELSESRVRTRSISRSSSYSRKQPRDVVKKSGFEAMMYRRPELVEEGGENEKNLAGYYHHEFPRPRVRDYNYTCIDVQTVGWCPPLRSTGCLPDIRLRSSTLHPVFYTESPDERLRKYRHLKRIAYKFRNPFLDFFLPYGFNGDTRGGPATPQGESFTGRRSNAIAPSYGDHAVSKCPIHNYGEDAEHDESSDDEDDENSSNKFDDGDCENNDNNDNNVNMRAGVRKGSRDEKALIQQSNECTKSHKKGNKNCQGKPTKKYPSDRKKMSDGCSCPCPTKAIPDTKASKPSKKGKPYRTTTKQPRCSCEASPERELDHEPAPYSRSIACSTVCTVISQRICIGKRSSIMKPMNFVESKHEWRYSQFPRI